MASVKLATVTSSIKGFHVYRRSPDICEKLKCVLVETNSHRNTAIKNFWDDNETTGHIPYLSLSVLFKDHNGNKAT